MLVRGFHCVPAAGVSRLCPHVYSHSGVALSLARAGMCAHDDSRLRNGPFGTNKRLHLSWSLCFRFGGVPRHGSLEKDEINVSVFASRNEDPHESLAMILEQSIYGKKRTNGGDICVSI